MQKLENRNHHKSSNWILQDYPFWNSIPETLVWRMQHACQGLPRTNDVLRTFRRLGAAVGQEYVKVKAALRLLRFKFSWRKGWCKTSCQKWCECQGRGGSYSQTSAGPQVTAFRIGRLGQSYMSACLIKSFWITPDYTNAAANPFASWCPPATTLNRILVMGYH